MYSILQNIMVAAQKSKNKYVTARPPTFPTFQGNIIDLIAAEDSNIASVNVYNGQAEMTSATSYKDNPNATKAHEGYAEITRIFKFNAKPGVNQVNITGLPTDLRQDSLRVDIEAEAEGLAGSATIDDISLSTVLPLNTHKTSPELRRLLSKQETTKKAIPRAKKSQAALDNLISSHKVKQADILSLHSVIWRYSAIAKDLDEEASNLQKELESINEAITQETKRFGGLKAVIVVSAELEGEVLITLSYAIGNATWKAEYDIRVDTQLQTERRSEKPTCQVVYKAVITQSTSEDWNNAQLILHTSTYNFDADHDVPALKTWTLSAYRQGSKDPGVVGAQSDSPRIKHCVPFPGERTNATFHVPELASITSDRVGHAVIITKLALDADVEWTCVPKSDTRVHRKAKINNTSDYTLLPGEAKVYVDRSFVSKSKFPFLSPGATFDCSLGTEPSIRVVYFPRIEKVTQSGVYPNKTTIHAFVQNITVHNTNSTLSRSRLNIKVVDQVPVSEDPAIIVNLIQPPLTFPVSRDVSFIRLHAKETITPIQVTAGWEHLDGVQETEEGINDYDQVDEMPAGKDGRFHWNCAVPPQVNVSLTLQWEVTYPSKTNVVGLYGNSIH